LLERLGTENAALREANTMLRREVDTLCAELAARRSEASRPPPRPPRPPVATDISAVGHGAPERPALAGPSLLLELIFQHSLDNIVILDRDYNFIRVSESYARSCHMPAADLVGRNHFEVFPSSLEQELAPFRRDRRTYRRAERPFVFPEHPEWGTTYWDLAMVPILDAAGEIEFQLFTLKDVTDRKRAEERTAKSEERLRLALEASGQATWEMDLRAMRIVYSPEPAYMLGSFPEGLLGRDWDAFLTVVHPDDRERLVAAFAAHRVGEAAKCQVEFRLRTRSGAWKWILVHGKVVERAADGSPVRMLGTLTDIDDRKDAELKIASSLREKETLLREIHHRVKNNLQVISSLLYFQGKKLQGPEVAAVFADLRQRILVMSLVHERLYTSNDVARVDFGEYVSALVTEIGRFFATRPGIRVEVAAEDVRLPIQQALPGGMIVCELVTNVLKYAFPGRREGRATVSVRKQDARVVVAVDDDGVGFPDGFERGTANSFGWELIRTLTLQLGGAVEAVTDRGAHVRVSFPAPAVDGAGQ
jgi:PAS domain S-box-containing protein